MLRYFPLLVQECAFEWRFPSFEPRALVLFEVATWMLTHSSSLPYIDDLEEYSMHVKEMVSNGVQPTFEKYGYRCTNRSDLALVTGLLEILVIVFKTVPNVLWRQKILHHIYQPYMGQSYIYDDLGLKIDKSAGTIAIGGETHKFTPIYQPLDF